MSSESIISTESPSIIKPFIHRKVTVKIDKLAISGILLGCDVSGHNGLGNLILQGPKRTLILRGEHVQVIAAVSSRDQITGTKRKADPS